MAQVKGIRERATSEAIGEGQMAVLVEHSTDGLQETANREGGEPKPKGPTVGKAKPGITFF